MLRGDTLAWTDVDRLRQGRGLVRHVTPEHAVRGRVQRGIPTFGRMRSFDGICRWCGQPIEEGRRAVWHTPCLAAYWAATAAQHRLREIVGAPHACPCGRPGVQLDHTDALSLASASGDVRRYRRALSFSNLCWLCHDCHAAKSGKDRIALRRMLAGPVPGRRVDTTIDWSVVQEALFEPDLHVAVG